MKQGVRSAYVIGAGVTGLSMAYFLARSRRYRVEIFEQREEVGGLSSTFERNNCYLDLGPHKFFSNLKDREKEVLSIIGKEKLLKIKKRSQIRLFDKFIDFPVGPVGILKINPVVGVKMGISYATAILKSFFGNKEEKSYEEYLKNRFGSVTYNLTFAPYARKIWAEPKSLDKDLAAARVVAPNLFEMVVQMVFKLRTKKSKEISADYFHYPKNGSGVFTSSLKDDLVKNGGRVRTSSIFKSMAIEKDRVRSIMVDDREIRLEKGDVLVSTIPIESLCQSNSLLVGQLRGVVSKLKYKNLVLVYIVVDKSSISHQNWYFFPETKYIFNRVFEQKNFSSYMIPESKTVLCGEVTCNSSDLIWKEKQDNKTIKVVIDQLISCGLVNRRDVVDSFAKRIERAYPIYEMGIRGVLDRIFVRLDEIENLYSIGRQGGFNYVGMIDCFDIGKKTADFILGQSEFMSRRELRDSFFDYIVID